MFDFQRPYDRKDIIAFLQNTLLPDDFVHSEEAIQPEFTPQFAKKIIQIGKVSSLKLAVYEIRHDSENDPRVGLSRDAFRLLAGYGQGRAVVLFASKSSDNYRLSLVTMELKEKAIKGTMREYSNPRRYSFFLGPDCKAHTPQQYLSKQVQDFDDLKGRFSIEVVTKEFYKEYAKVFSEIETAINKLNKMPPESLRLYTQTLMNRLMFLRFLEKKKWIQFGNSSDYLANLYSVGGLQGQSFYKSRLCPLFFEALAIEGRQNSDLVGKTVFLNGGLFEQTELDRQISDVPDTAFKGLFCQEVGKEGLFYKYNFTVEESTPIDIEVAVDPEMLGKVFEELVTGRHESGSYYTPRPIVSFMCREALKGYLESKTSASKRAIDLLVDGHEIASDLTNKHAEEILFYLETLKAVDPACGSGAYLLGLLQELIEIRKVLQNQNLKADPDFIYKIKLRLISHCLYGVDIDPFATNIAKLRLWLSLAVDTESPQPLPNLDFKIETGDSILGPCDPLADSEDALVMSALRERAKKLVLKKDQFMMAHGEEKTKLYDEIKAEESAIAEETSTVVGKGVIVWHVHFAEVFTSGRKTESTMDGQFGFMADAQKQKTFKIAHYEPGGFDIVLANPPYIRQELIKDNKPRLQEIFKETFTGTADLYTYFYTRAVELLAVGGVLSFISSNKWFRANYGKYLRKYITKSCDILSITDFGELPVFETAATFPMIFVAQKTEKRTQAVFTQVKTLDFPYPDVKAIIEQNGNMLPEDAIKGDTWNLTDSKTLKLLRKMEASGVPLKEYVNGEIYYGIKTGFNDAFVIDGTKREELLSEDPASEDLIKPMAKGDDVRKWHILNKDQWMIVTPIGVDIDKYPAVFKHLKRWKKELQNRQDQGNHWWELRACSYYHIFESPKIHYPEIAKEPRFAYDDSGIYPLKTVFTIPIGDLFLLGILNSSPAWEYLKNVCSVLGDENKGGRLTLQTVFVEQLPIPKASGKDRKEIEMLVQKCLDAKGQNCEKWEAQIDKIVTRLYGLEE